MPRNLPLRRRGTGWNLIEVIVAVAIMASLAAAGTAVYVTQALRASVQRAEAFISTVETMKQTVRYHYFEHDDPTLVDDAACAVRVLQNVRVQGKALSGDPVQDANTLGFQLISLGTFDTLDGMGTVISPGNTATVQLKTGRVITSTDR